MTKASTDHHRGDMVVDMTDANEDLKAKMREALDKKNAGRRGVKQDTPLKEKAHGSEVAAGGPSVHRRKAGGGGA